MHGVLNIDKKKLITQFVCKSRDESFKPSYSMIGQYLSNKNESATVSKSKKFLDLNNPSEERLRPCLVHSKNQKLFKIPVTSNLTAHARSIKYR